MAASTRGIASRSPAGSPDPIALPASPSPSQSSSSLSSSSSSLGRAGSNGPTDSDLSDDPEDGDDLQEQDEEDDKAGASHSTASVLQQAHLTPHRPSRNRRPPAWLTDDLATPLSARSKQQSPALTSVGRSRSAQTGSPSKRATYGKGKQKTLAVQDSDSSELTSSEDEDEEIPQTPSKRRATSRPDAATGSASRLGRLSPTKAKTPSRSQASSAGPITPSRRGGPPTNSVPRSGSGSGSRSRAKGQTPVKKPKSRSTPQQLQLPEQIISSRFIQATSADHYFAAHTTRRRAAARNDKSWSSRAAESAARSSRKGLADLPALSSKQVARLSLPGSARDPLSNVNLQTLALSHYRAQYHTWLSLLLLDNDVVFYGVGAKEMVIEDFVRRKAPEAEAATVIVRGKMGARTEDWVDSIEEALDSGTASVSGGVEGRLRRILKTLDDASDSSRFDQPRRLFLVLHSLDSPALLTSRTRSHLQLLSSSPFVHILATVSHPNSHMLADYTVSYKRQLWIDCTTLLPHLDDCLITGAGVRIGGLPRAFDLRAGGGVGGLTGMGSMSGPDGGQSAGAGGMTSAAEMHSANSNAPLLGATAALHVLRSVTTKAKALFLKLASELQNQAGGSTDKTTFSSRSLPFSRLSHLAARNFIATSEPALRSLLVEFTSHGLVRVAKDDASGGEIVQLRMEGEAEVKTVVDGVKQL